jgi:hypothetical protein
MQESRNREMKEEKWRQEAGKRRINEGFGDRRVGWSNGEKKKCRNEGQCRWRDGEEKKQRDGEKKKRWQEGQNVSMKNKNRNNEEGKTRIKREN